MLNTKITSLLFLLFTSISIVLAQNQFHPVFPQNQTTRFLQNAFQNAAHKSPIQNLNQVPQKNSFQAILNFKKSLPKTLVSIENKRGVYCKNQIIDTIIVGYLPNDTLRISGSWSHNGPIFVFNDGVLIIHNASISNYGDVYIFGHGKLLADSSSLTFPQQYFYERSLLIVQHGFAKLQNCSLNYSGYSHSLYMADSAKAEFTTIHQHDFTTCGLFGSPSITINGCNLTGEYILSDKSNAVFKHADTVLLWHQFPDSAIINYAFPSGDTVNTYLFNKTISGVSGIGYSVEADTCYHVWWALMPVNGSDITLSNSTIRAIGAWFMRGDTVSVTSLYDNSTYINYVMPVNDRNLHLINSSVQTWSLYAFDSSQVTISTCQLGEVGCQNHSSAFASQFILDGSGGYFWATDTSFIFANNVDVYSTVRAERNGIFVLGYGWLPFLAPAAIGNGLIVSVQNNLVLDPVAYNNAVAWLSNIDVPDTAFTNTSVTVNGSAWIDQGPDGGWMDFGSYSLFYQVFGDTAWTPILLNDSNEIRKNLLATWNTQSLVSGNYLLRLQTKNNLGDNIDDYKAITLIQNPSGIGNNIKVLNSASVFPNPSTGDFKIEVHAEKSMRGILRIYTSVGQLVVETSLTLTEGKNIFSLQNKLASGIYSFQLSAEQLTYNGKIEVR